MYAFMVQMLGTQEKHAQINEYNGNKNAIKKKIECTSKRS